MSRLTHAPKRRILPVVQVEWSVEFRNRTLIENKDSIIEGDRGQPMGDAKARKIP